MTIHALNPGDRVLWNCAFGPPLEVVIDRTDGFGPTGEPEYLVSWPDQPAQASWTLPQHVLHVLGSPESASASERHLAPLIGVVGKKRAGKDSVAAVLTQEYGFERVAFADLLKEMALDLNPILSSNLMNFQPRRLQDVVEYRGWELAKEMEEGRRILQVLGVTVRERLGEDIWVDAAMAKVQELRKAGTPVVVTDVRFPNELEAIHSAGGQTWRINRPGIVSDDQHISETALDGDATHYTLINDRTLSDLANWVRFVAVESGLQVKHTQREEAAA